MLRAVTLKNYRSYTQADYEFGDGVSIIIGPNASGKTNLLESVYLLATGSSFRVNDKELIHTDSSWARIDGLFSDHERTIKLEESIKTKKTFILNDTKYSRLSFDSTIPVVLFDPEDVRLIGGSPERRRKFMDTLLSQSKRDYKQTLSKYNRALKQRNTLLKKGNATSSLFTWNIILTRSAEELTRARYELIEQINTTISDVYSKIASKDSTTSLTLTNKIPIESYGSSLLKSLEHNQRLDMERGYTSVGPHRDDLLVQLNGRPANVSASRGESRTITLALKMIEVDIVRSSRSIKPILLFDDVFSELDGSRRKSLTEFLGDHQAIITTTDADVVGKKFTSHSQLISL